MYAVARPPIERSVRIREEVAPLSRGSEYRESSFQEAELPQVGDVTIFSALKSARHRVRKWEGLVRT